MNREEIMTEVALWVIVLLGTVALIVAACEDKKKHVPPPKMETPLEYEGNNLNEKP